MWPIETLAVVAVAFLLAGFSKGLVGLGLPTVSLTVLTLAIGIRDAVPLMLIPATITNIYQAAQGPYLPSIIKRLWPLMAASVVTIILVGSEIAAAVDTALLTGIFGLLMASYAAISLAAFQLPPPGKLEPVASPFVGAVGGVVTGLTGSFVVPAVFYVQSLGLKRDELVQAMGMMFVVTTVAVGAGWTRLGIIEDQTTWLVSALALIPAVLGMYIGSKVRKKIPEQTFRRVFFLAILIIGGSLAVRNLVP